MKRILRAAGNLLLIFCLLFFVWLTGGAVAGGWSAHADHYGAAFSAYAVWYYIAAGGLTVSVLLYFLKKDLPAMVVGILSYLPMPVILLRAMHTAEANGWGGQTEATFGRTAAEIWRNGQMWNFVVVILLLLLAATRYFSYDAVQMRKAAANAPAPTILDDSIPQSLAKKQSNRQKSTRPTEKSKE